MTRKNAAIVLGAAARILLAFVFISPQTAGLTQGLTAQEAASGGPREGIKVHGHWTIELRNPDGTLASHREFENALTTPNSLAPYLARVLVPGRWNLFVGSGATSSLDPCAGGALVAPYQTPTCVITERDSYVASLGVRNAFPTLSVGAIGNGGQQLQLTGTAQAMSNGQIDTVASYQETCANSIASSACNAANSGQRNGAFTQARVVPAISVSAGQTIAVTVLVSFS